MPNFRYKAKKEDAGTENGEIVAASAEEAVEALARRGVIPVFIEEVQGQGPGVAASARQADLALFTRQLAGLLRSGIPLLQSLEALQRQTRSAGLSRVLGQVIAGVRNGRSFSDALRDHPGVFPEVYAAMARAGEESGRLRDFLANLAAHLKRQEETASRIRAALVYPLFMLVVGAGTVVFILTVVMPRIAVLYQGMGGSLPWPTRVVTRCSHALAAGWPALLLVLAGAVLAWRVFASGGRGRRWRGTVMAAIPWVGDFVVKADLERLARVLGMLLGSGIPLLAAMEVAEPTLWREDLRAALSQARERVAGGAGVGDALRDCGVLPEMFVRLVAVGEESGELAAAFTDIADTLDEEMLAVTRLAMTLLEPVMILLVGAVVGFIVFAMLLPVFQMDIFAR